ncbi:MAG: hypothetical protein HeimC3_54530 [Candidatus Heimdallarchaeota archaeon LC_3]|nr:MAG: hypothetical protein HeimC3_54530 [Candidatus Heimdallarchaeota archaeon LC_3]
MNSDKSAQWAQKESEQLLSQVYKLALLSIIYENQQVGGIHGYAIGQALYDESEGGLSGSNATYYAILRRMEKDSLLNSEIVESTSGPSRKHYFLTTLGENALNDLWKKWKYYYSLLNDLIKK